jgi:hypothetical protein
MQHQITTRLARLFAIALTGLTLAGLSGCATHSGTEGIKITAAANEQIVMEEFMVPSGDAGINLYVRNKRLKSTTSFNKDNVVLFVHGATYPSETGFDLRLDGLSWMDVMAQQGYDVYMVDIRGYGKSTRPAIMDQPAADNKPFADSLFRYRQEDDLLYEEEWNQSSGIWEPTTTLTRLLTGGDCTLVEISEQIADSIKQTIH